MAQGDIFELRLNYTMYGQKLVNVMHFENVDAAGSGDERLAVAEIFAAYYRDDLLACLVEDITLQSASVRGVGTNQTQYLDTLWGMDGTIAQAPVPTNISAIVSWYAMGVGPRYRGRNYIPGISRTQSGGGILTPSYFNLFAAYAAHALVEHLDSTSGYTMEQCLWSAAFPTAKNLTSVRVQSRTGVMRSRTIGVGV